MMRVIVIGAGMVGTSTTFRLAQAGADVMVIDRSEPGSGTTSNSFAWVNANQKTPRKYFELNVAGMKEHDRLDEDLGGAPWIHRTGNLVWTGDPVRYDDLHRRMERLQSWGYNAKWITGGDVNRDLEPHIVLSGPTMRVAWFPDESWLDGPEFVRTVLDRAVQEGASVRSGQEVTGIAPGPGDITVSLSDGQQLTADAVVNSAGPSADKIAALVGRTLPLAPTRGLLVRVKVERGQLSRIIHGPDVNMRPDGDGYALLHHDSIDTLIGDQESIPLDDPLCRELCKRARRLLPSINASNVSETRVGIRPYPADNVSCIGNVPGVPGYYEAVTHSGVTLGPLLGRLVTEEIMTGTIDPLIQPFRAERFAHIGSD
jgi:glycine/D-amino acid oxidase-like deaminating enzyme